MQPGVICAVVTPWVDGDIAADTLRRHLDDLLDRGVRGLIMAGSSGEAHLLSVDERQRLLDIALDHMRGRAQVMLGVTAPSTRETAALCRYAARAGAAGILITPPYYYRPSFDELRGFLAAACDAARLPAMLYNTPGATGIDVTPDVLARLVETVPLEAIKESSGDVTRIPEINRLTPRLRVYVGTDTIALAGLRAGGVGWVTGAANIIPAQAVGLYAGASRGSTDADLLFDAIRPLCVYLEESGRYVQCLKAGLEILGRSVGAPRLPLLPLEPALEAELRRHLNRAVSATVPMPAD